MKNTFKHCALFIVAGLLTACGGQADSPEPADTVLRGGTVYTLNPEQPWAEAVATRNGEIVYVGDSAGAAAFVGEATKVFELNGEMVLPGLHDSHVHAMSSQLRTTGLKFSTALTAEEVIEVIREYAEAYPDANVIVGGDVGMDEDLNRDLLDTIDSERPILIGQDGGHSLWANGAALDAAGITDDTPNPDGGKIVRDENGRANGLLIDTARGAVRGIAAGARQSPTEEQRQQAVRDVQKWFNSFGITSIKELHGGKSSLDTYKAVDDAGELTIRVSQHLTFRPQTPEQEEEFYAFLETRDQYRSDKLNPDFIKMNMDGIPGTNYMLENYEGNNNTPLIDPEVLKERFIRLDAMGMSIAVHSHGDASIRAVLDAAEAARNANGPDGPMHQNAHSSMPHKDDLPRFRELNVVAEVSPHTWYPSDTFDWVATMVPDWVMDMAYPARWFADAGAVVAAGSDWDSNTLTVNPFPAIESLITRKDPHGTRDDRLGTIEGLTVEQAIAAYTTGGAYAARRDDLGSLEVGKRADIAVLNQNLLEIPVEDISETKAVYTFLDGELVYSAE